MLGGGLYVSDLLAAARKAESGHSAHRAGVHKMSTLVQWAKIEAIDARTGRIVLDKLLQTFAATRTKPGARPKPSSLTNSQPFGPRKGRGRYKSGASNEKRIFLAPPPVARRLRPRPVMGRRAFGVPCKRRSIAD